LEDFCTARNYEAHWFDKGVIYSLVGADYFILVQVYAAFGKERNTALGIGGFVF
jgi:hypothetical protein